VTLEEAADHIGSTVVYAPPDGPHLDETGVITAVTSRYVFVRYHGDTHSKATAPANLHLTAAGGP
jgi:GrpB-like predicted nucleotidyltransferase (UPF0157 family)